MNDFNRGVIFGICLVVGAVFAHDILLCNLKDYIVKKNFEKSEEFLKKCAEAASEE
jgi:hypothetical protein